MKLENSGFLREKHILVRPGVEQHCISFWDFFSEAQEKDVSLRPGAGKTWVFLRKDFF